MISQLSFCNCQEPHRPAVAPKKLKTTESVLYSYRIFCFPKCLILCVCLDGHRTIKRHREGSQCRRLGQLSTPASPQVLHLEEVGTQRLPGGGEPREVTGMVLRGDWISLLSQEAESPGATPPSLQSLGMVFISPLEISPLE